MSTLTAPRPRSRQQARPRTGTRHASSRLGRYTDDHSGTAREIVCLPGAKGSRLVIDRDALTRGDRRLVAHLAVDEPAENARIVAELYLAEESKGSCRRVSAEDFKLTPFDGVAQSTDGDASLDTSLLDPDGYVYRIHDVPVSGSLRELRWTRSRHPRQEEPFDVITVRGVVGRLEGYEPVRAITTAALAVHNDSDGDYVSVCRLGDELERLSTSSVVLNRGLREAVQRTIARGEVSMSEIATRCGRIKQDKRGNQSGETSWLARRIGTLPEGREAKPTPWVHTDVLALIVREGLGISPREVEL